MIQVQVLPEAVYFSQSAYFLGRVMNPTILPLTAKTYSVF